MRIGIDINPLTETRTGVGNYLFEILIWLDKNAKEHEFYLYSPKSDFLDLPKLGPNFHLYMLHSKHRNIANQTELPKQLKKDHIDVFWGSAFHLPARNHNTKNIRFVLTIHDLWAQTTNLLTRTPKNIVIDYLMKRDAKNADSIICVSGYTKKEVHRLYQVSPKNMFVTYLAPSDDKHKKMTKSGVEETFKKFELVDKDGKIFPYLLFVSTIQPRKNLDTCLTAFEIYKKKHDDNLKLVIVGGRGWDCDETFAHMENSPAKSDIIYLGYVSSEKSVLYEKSKAFVYPSLCEGFGIPILEAYQNHTLVITAENSSLPEVGGKPAFYLKEATDAESLEALYEKVVNLPAKSREARIKQSDDWLKGFSWDKCARETLTVIETGHL